MAYSFRPVVRRLDLHFSAKHKCVISLTFGLIALLGIGDHISGPELSFSVFYVAPIALATWYAGKASGFLASVASAAAWLIADLTTGHQYAHPWIPIWNSLVRLFFFLIIALLLSSIQRRLEIEANLAKTDPLTGLANSRRFYEQLEAESIRSKRYHHTFTLAYIDLDNFKLINDRQGHAMGDQVLQTVGTAITRSIRTSDFVARVGGDEFVALFPETEYETAERVIQRFRQNLHDEIRSRAWPITFSIGAITLSRHDLGVNEMIRHADDLMYQVKRRGKNNLLHEIWNGEEAFRKDPPRASHHG